jgi:hypothetical protein
MSVVSQWDNDEKTIMVYTLGSTFTWDEFYAAKAHGDGLIDMVSHRVVVIFDGPSDVKLPEDFMTNVININKLRHPRAALAVTIMPNNLVRAILNTANRLYKREFAAVRFVPNLEEGRAVARQFLAGTLL